MNLHNKKIVLIGGASSIGLEAAKQIIHLGGNVIITSRLKTKLENAKVILENNISLNNDFKNNAVTYLLDITKLPEIKKFFATIKNFDHLVLITSDRKPILFSNINILKAKEIFEVQFWGQFYAVKYSIPFLNEKSSITLFSGVSAHKAIPGCSIISASHGATELLTRTLALELKPIRINAISSGPINNSYFDKYPIEAKNNFFQNLKQLLPINRVGQPEDVAETILYLIQNEFTTGTIVDINGGCKLI